MSKPDGSGGTFFGKNPIVSKLKKPSQVHNAGFDIDFYDETVKKKVTKYIRYHSTSNNNDNDTNNTWNVNAPIRMDPTGDPDSNTNTTSDGILMPITIGKRPKAATSGRGWSIVATNNSFIIRNEDSNQGEGQIVFTAKSRD
jgi:hypothetical protein